MNSSFLSCSYGSVCSGCDQLLLPSDDQRRSKSIHLGTSLAEAISPAWPEVQFTEVDKGGLRDRVDLMIDTRTGGYRVGLFDRFRTGIVDLQGCPQLSPALEAWYQEFRRSVHLPVTRGSLRLRVSPQGVRGVWFDFANVDIKTWLDERTQFERLLSLGAIVEIGQRRKRLVRGEDRLKLADPILEPWFETYLRDGRSQSLYCAIGSFTQPGFRANRALVESVMDMVSRTTAKKIIEFGSGIGNFTLPLASVAESVRAFEVDELALEGLRRSLEESGLTPRVEIRSGNFQVERKEPVDYRGADLIFVDPPRSGLMKFLDPLEALTAAERPRHFVYVSCFTESFVTDTRRLRAMGYAPREVKIVDQFPQSRHYEIVARLERLDGV